MLCFLGEVEVRVWFWRCRKIVTYINRSLGALECGGQDGQVALSQSLRLGRHVGLWYGLLFEMEEV